MYKINRNLINPITILVLFVTIIMLGVSTSDASALTYQSEHDVSFTINPMISVDLSSSDLVISDLTPGTAADSNIVTVTVSTNASHGYYLAATAGTSSGDTYLTNTQDSNYKFTNLSSNVASLSNFTNNTWGYSYSTDNGTTWVSGSQGSTSTGYNGLPLDNDDNGATGVTLVDTTNPVAGSSVKFKIGAKSADTQAAGTYTNTVNFYAVTNPAPMTFDDAYAAAGKTKTNGYYTMQDATSSICSAVYTGAVGRVIDTRDNTAYTIGKLADGKCWLLDNLALDLTDSNILNSLSSANTNIDSTNESAILTSLKSGNRTAGDQYATAGLTVWDSNSTANSYSVPKVNMASKDVVPQGSDPMASTVLAGNWKVGGYYNYCAASAGSYCYGQDTSQGTSSGNATSDICPKGWRLPTGNTSGEYQALYNNANYNTYNNYRLALRLPLSGYFSNGSALSQGSLGSFWSSTRSTNSSMYDLYLDTSGVSPSDYYGRNYGNSVRCVLGS